MRIITFLFFLFPLFVQAKLAFEQTVIDAQAGPKDKEYVGVYAFTNTGRESVTIANVSSSCGCTTPELNKKTYAPGESGEIKAKFDFGSRTGKQSKTITVLIEGEPKERIQLRLNVEIPQPLAIAPRVLSWSAEENLKPKTITITVGEGIPGHPSVADPAPAGYQFSFKKVADQPNQFTLTVTPTQGEPTERGRRFSIELIDHKDPEKVIATIPGFLVIR